MKALRIGGDIWQLERAQWRDRGWLRRVQERKLRALVEHAYRTVPFYRARLDDAGIAPGDIRSADDLARLPITTRAELQSAPVDDRTSSAFRQDQLMGKLTSGRAGRERPDRIGGEPRPAARGKVPPRPPRFARGLVVARSRSWPIDPSCPIDPFCPIEQPRPRLRRRAERRTRPSHTGRLRIW